MPFTHDQFLDAFAAYHRAAWPGAVALWLLTLVTLWALVRGRTHALRAALVLLAAHWAWSALAYHWAVFRAG